MVTRETSASLVAALVLAGCYDLERLDPGPESSYLLVDDFEDDNDSPRPPFDAWQAAPFNGNPSAVSLLGFTAGNDGGQAFVAEFTLVDPGNQDNTGLSVGVVSMRERVEARAFRAIHFGVRFDSGNTPFPTNTRFYVQLGCDSAPPLGSVTSPFWVQLLMTPTPTNSWQTLKLPLENFSEPTDMGSRINGGLPACLARVDSVRFTLSTNIMGQGPVSGSLYLDDVYFE